MAGEAQMFANIAAAQGKVYNPITNTTGWGTQVTPPAAVSSSTGTAINGTVYPATTTENMTPPAGLTIQQQVQWVQDKIADLQAQQSAMAQYGLTDTEQLTKDATGNYVPLSATGNEVLDATLAAIQSYLDRLAATGKTIDPYVDITPEKMAEFMKQAENEIDPYYSTQLKLARESILTDLDYSKDEIGKFEQDLEKTYGKSLRTLGENAAEQGFAMSGQRNLNEQDLAYQAQSQMENKRDAFAYNAGKAARQFAQEWGKPDFTPTMSAMPTVKAGERSFATSGTQAPLYELSNDIYDQLQGSKQYEATAAKLTRQAQLEEAWKTSELSNRYLSLA